MDFEEMTPGQINLKEMATEQLGFGQMSTTKINALKNGFSHTIVEIALFHLILN